MNEGRLLLYTTYGLDELRQAGPLFGASSVAIGNFDGVHRGHAQVLAKAVERAQALDATSVALTFEPHPRAVVGGGAPPLLAPAAKGRELMAAIGIKAAVALHFDHQVAHLAPDQFVRRVLVEGLAARHVVVGDNFRFGHRAAGTVRLLDRLGNDLGFTVETVPAVREGDVPISSSVIRRLVQEGDVLGAATLLGRDFEVEGIVVPGEGRGTSLGFATANVVPESGLLLPGPGVYAARVGDEPAVAIVGDKPTFGYGQTVLEVHILDYWGDLRGKQLQVRFLRRLRGVRKFDSACQLQKQMADDVRRVRRFFQAGILPEVSG